MANRALKAFRSIFLEGQWNRLWQIVNKTSLIHTTAFFYRLTHWNVFQNRVKVLKSQTLPPDVQKTFEDLQSQGYARVDHLLNKSDFDAIEKYLAEKKSQQEKIQNSQVVKTKDFWVRLSDEDLSKGLTTNNPLVHISLSEKILQLASRYLGQAAFLEYVLLTLSLPSNKPLQASQLWHRDHDNHRMLKMFIYLTDVLEDGDGPFTFFSAPLSEKVPNSFIPRHLPDQAVYPHIGEKNLIQMKGRKWTAFVCDTSRCYHMGSRLQPGHERLMLTSLFIALPSPYPTYGQNKIQATTSLSSLQKKAIEA